MPGMCERIVMMDLVAERRSLMMAKKSSFLSLVISYTLTRLNLQRQHSSVRLREQVQPLTWRNRAGLLVESKRTGEGVVRRWYEDQNEHAA